jgi:penicillin-binding protein 1A
MSAMLEKVIEEGTARSLIENYGVSMDLAGKTGTSQNYSDAWFIAYNRQVVAATWVGGIYPLIRFRSGAYGSSSKQALPLLAYFFQELQRSPELQDYRDSLPELSENWQAELSCDDYREKDFFDGLRNLLDKREGERIKRDEDKPGLFQRIFGKKDRS